MKQQAFWLGPDEDEAVRVIMARYGCESKSQALRLALRVVAASPMLTVSLPPTPPHARHSRKEEQAGDGGSQA